MCGLVGVYSSNMLLKHKEVLTTLLYLDTFRGKDSTGVAALRSNADTHIMKSTVPGYEFIDNPRLETHLRLTDFCWIGHNRFGTIGKNIKSNAHPFEVLDDDGGCLLVGAHNGTLRNKHILTNHSLFGTDSEALFNSIASEGVEKTMEKVEGAWALTYYDHDLEELRFLRNKERPLFYAFEEGNKTLVWASEIWMIRVAMTKAGLKLQDDAIHEVKEDTLYSFPVPLKTNDILTVETKEGVVGKAPAFFQGQRTWTGHGGTGGNNTQPQTTTQTSAPRTIPALAPHHNVPSSSTPSTTKSGTAGEKQHSANVTSSKERPASGNNIRDILSAKNFKGFGGKPLSKGELLDQLAGGCGWCEVEFVNMDDRFAWLAEGFPICHKCLDGTHPEPVTPVKTNTVH